MGLGRVTRRWGDADGEIPLRDWTAVVFQMRRLVGCHEAVDDKGGKVNAARTFWGFEGADDFYYCFWLLADTVELCGFRALRQLGRPASLGIWLGNFLHGVGRRYYWFLLNYTSPHNDDDRRFGNIWPSSWQQENPVELDHQCLYDFDQRWNSTSLAIAEPRALEQAQIL
jgi:hypothetical protein